MKCPVCDVTLSISAREGVEIDFCPQCRGIWLDRGELDKILDRVATVPGSARAEPDESRNRGDDRYDRPSFDERPRYQDPPHRHDDRPRYDDRDRKRRKKRSFLEEILDFD